MEKDGAWVRLKAEFLLEILILRQIKSIYQMIIVLELKEVKILQVDGIYIL